MKRNYLKPLCAVVPIKASRLLAGSLKIDTETTVDTQYSRENDYADYPRSSSVWDD